MTDPITGIRLGVSPRLVGSKKAVQVGDGPVLLSPAMYDLVKHAEGDELRRLLAAIPVLRLPDYTRPSSLADLPLTPFRFSG